MKSGRPRVAVVLLAGAVSLALSACANSNSGSSASGSSSSGITIGMIGPMTGVRADVGAGMTSGGKIALAVINANGGVLGHKVSLEVQDDAGDPGDAVPAADQEISSNVAAIVGPTALTASVVLPLAQKAKLPDLMWGGGSAFDRDTDPDFFRMTVSDSAQAQAMVLYAHQKGWNRVALAIGNQSADQSLTPPLIATAKALGMTITGQVTIAINSTSFRSEISKLYSGHPQAILSQFDIPSAGVLFSELQQQGLTSTPWVASNLWYASEFFHSVGATAATGPVYIVNPGTGGPGEQAFLKALQAQTGKTEPTNGQEIEWDSVTAWALGALEAKTFASPQIEAGILKAADGPGTVCYDFPTCASLLKSGKAINFDGAASTVDFNKYHNVFGPFEILHYTKSGSVQTVEEITAKQIAAVVK
jgi:ABC-type branched-subunit amino acid transport system substrate-binding protein